MYKHTNMKTEKFKKPAMETELSSCLKVFEFIGLQFFSLKDLTVDNSKKRPTFFRAVFMMVFVTIICLLMIGFILKDNTAITGKVSAKTIVMHVIQRSFNIGMILVCCSSTIQSFVSTLEIKRVFMNLKEIEKIINQEFSVQIDFKTFKENAWKRLYIMLTSFTILHGGTSLFHMYEEDIVVKIFLGALPVLFLIMIVYKMIFFVALINFSLRLLDDLITDIFQYQPINIIDNINYHLTSVKTTENLLERLRAARKIFNIIFENGALINKSNGLTTLIILTTVVISLTVAGYEAFVIFVGGIPIRNITGNSCNNF